jgi:ABC-type proline/glycine betaine transport system ATPase subunit
LEWGAYLRLTVLGIQSQDLSHKSVSNLALNPARANGSSGSSGKTTLGKLILGLYPATDGKVLIDRHDVSGVSLQPLRSQIGLVD